MDITIGVHTIKRASERGITEAGIKAILNERPVVMFASNNDKDAAIVVGTFAGKKWSVVININTFHTITVRRAWKKEEKIYDQTRT